MIFFQIKTNKIKKLKYTYYTQLLISVYTKLYPSLEKRSKIKRELKVNQFIPYKNTNGLSF